MSRATVLLFECGGRYAMKATLDKPGVLDLSPGEIVRVRTADEILSTLDEHGTLENLPFMPEMLRYCGRTLHVFKRADKTCDGTTALRRMQNVVHLSSIRCDGSAHGGCQAGCLMYWKEAWLQRVESQSRLDFREGDAGSQDNVADALLQSTTRASSSTSESPVYRCQATEIPDAASRLRGWEFDQYARDVRNWGLWKVVHGMAIEVFNKIQKISSRYLPMRLVFHGGQTYPFIDGRLDKWQTASAQLDLRPGDLVRIKSKEEIVKTLDHSNHNRGLSFDVEMVPYCGRTARVRARVERIIDERSGKMIKIKHDCIILDDVVCGADYHRFCTRSIYSFWREVWLEKMS